MHNFRLKVGDVVKLTKTISGIYKCDDWKSGFYRVNSIGPGVGSYESDKHLPRVQVYRFEKIKKDGTKYTTFRYYGYNCIAFDKILEENSFPIVQLTDLSQSV